jgi:hypothetical protein
MFFPWYSSVMLALESQQVIGLRLMKMAIGGAEAQDEVHLMMSEKVEASLEAGETLMAGGTIFSVIDRYREHVAANTSRLLTV